MSVEDTYVSKDRTDQQDGQSLDEEIIKAKQRYKIGLADDDSYVLYAAEIEDEIIDQQSMSCSSESDAFDEDTISIYDDDECPDTLVEDGEYIPKNTPFLPAPWGSIFMCMSNGIS